MDEEQPLCFWYQAGSPSCIQLLRWTVMKMNDFASVLMEILHRHTGVWWRNTSWETRYTVSLSPPQMVRTWETDISITTRLEYWGSWDRFEDKILCSILISSPQIMQGNQTACYEIREQKYVQLKIPLTPVNCFLLPFINVFLRDYHRYSALKPFLHSTVMYYGRVLFLSLAHSITICKIKAF